VRDIDRLSRIEKLKAHLAYCTMRLMGWRPIETAPKDGTEILVIEGHDDSVASMYHARWHTPYHHPEVHAPNESPYWWGLSWRIGFSHWDNDYPVGKPENVAISPLWWKPLRNRSARMGLIHYWSSWVCYDKQEAKETV
jgi:hypothetical protein